MTSIMNEDWSIERCLARQAGTALYKVKSPTEEPGVFVVKIFSGHELDTITRSIACERFKNEIAITRAIDHPAIIKLYDFCWEPGFGIYSMEYAGGGDLKKLLKDRGPLPPTEALNLLIKIAEGVQIIHQAGYIHCDLKLENILLSHSGKPKIADFGIARCLHESSTKKDSKIMGSPGYLSPEYVTDGILDERADIYALGVLAYKLLSADRPFAVDSRYNALVAHIIADPIALRQHVPSIPARIEEVVMKAMCKDPEDRFQSVTEFLHALESCLPMTSAFDHQSYASTISALSRQNTRPSDVLFNSRKSR